METKVKEFDNIKLLPDAMIWQFYFYNDSFGFVFIQTPAYWCT